MVDLTRGDIRNLGNVSVLALSSRFDGHVNIGPRYDR